MQQCVHVSRRLDLLLWVRCHIGTFGKFTTSWRCIFFSLFSYFLFSRFLWCCSSTHLGLYNANPADATSPTHPVFCPELKTTWMRLQIITLATAVSRLVSGHLTGVKQGQDASLTQEVHFKPTTYFLSMPSSQPQYVLMSLSPESFRRSLKTTTEISDL